MLGLSGKAEMRYAALGGISSVKNPSPTGSRILRTVKSWLRVVWDDEEVADFKKRRPKYSKTGTVEEKIWFTYIEEGIGKSKEEFGLVIFIADWISVWQIDLIEAVSRSDRLKMSV